MAKMARPSAVFLDPSGTRPTSGSSRHGHLGGGPAANDVLTSPLPQQPNDVDGAFRATRGAWPPGRAFARVERPNTRRATDPTRRRGSVVLPTVGLYRDKSGSSAPCRHRRPDSNEPSNKQAVPCRTTPSNRYSWGYSDGTAASCSRRHASRHGRHRPIPSTLGKRPTAIATWPTVGVAALEVRRRFQSRPNHAP